MAACFFNRHPSFCRQRVQSFVDGREHFGRLFRRLVEPMPQDLLLLRVKLPDGFLDCSELGHGMEARQKLPTDNRKNTKTANPIDRRIMRMSTDKDPQLLWSEPLDRIRAISG